MQNVPKFNHATTGNNDIIVKSVRYRRIAKAGIAALLVAGLVAVGVMVFVRTDSNTAYGLSPCDDTIAPTPGPARPWESSLGVSTYSSANVHTGNLFTAMPVVSWSGHGPGLNMMLYHNSAHVNSGYDLSKGSGVDLGPGWSVAYGDQLVLDIPNNKVTVLWADGRVDEHMYTGGQWHAPPGVHDQLEQDTVDTDIWRVRHKNGWYHKFEDQTADTDIGAVRLTSIVDATGNALTVNHETIGTSPNTSRRIDNVVAAGRTLDFQYDAVTGRLEKFFDSGDGDFMDREWPLVYDAGSGQMSSLVDARGNENAFEYDSSGRITLTTDKRKFIPPDPLCIGATGDCTAPTEPYTPGCNDARCCAAVCQEDDFCCDVFWDQTCATCAETVCPTAEPEYTFTYDTDGHLDKVTDPANSQVSTLFAYSCVSVASDEYRRRTTYTDVRGNKWKFSFIEHGVFQEPNNIGTLEWTENPLFKRHNFTFNVERQLTFYYDPTNRGFTATYDSNGNLLTMQNMELETQTWTYHWSGNNTVTSYTDGAGNIVRFYYDDATYSTLLTAIVEPNATSNPPAGQPDPAGYPVTKMTYHFPSGGGCSPLSDGHECHGMLHTVTDPNDVVTRFTYDQWGQTDKYFEGLKSGIYGYTLNTDLNSAGFPTGGSTTGVGTTTDCTGGGGVATAASSAGTISSDANGNILSSGCVSSQALLFGTQECSWAAFPFSCSAPDIPERFATFSNAKYDAMDRSLETRLSLTVGGPTTKERKLTHSYDALGRLAERRIDSYETGPRVERTFLYDHNDVTGLSTRTGPDGNETLVQLDAANRVQSVQRRHPSGTPVYMSATHTYFDNDQVESITYGNGLETLYGYDAAGRVWGISHQDQANTNVHLQLDYTYDARGLPTSITEKSGAVGSLSTDAVTTFTYDRRGRLLTEVRIDFVGSTNYNLAYTYDEGGNRTKKVNSTAGTCTKYEYDIDQPLVYDTANNRLMKEQFFTDTYCINLASQKFYDYNSDGNVTRVTTVAAASGGGSSSMSSGGGELLSTTSSGTLDASATGVTGGTTQAAAPGGGGYCPTGKTEYNAIRFGYAKNGQAVTFVHDEKWCVDDGCGIHSCGKTTDCTSNYSISFAKEFRYDGARARYLVRDLDPNDFSVVVSEVWSDYDGDTLYGDFDPGSGASLASHEPGTWRSVIGIDDYLHNDMIGTLRTTTDENGLPITGRVFTAFGEQIAGPQDRNGYAGAWGYQSHSDFEFQHVGHRYYDPASGRFLQRDPIGVVGGANVYAYVRNRPTASTDASGLIPPGGHNPNIPGDGPFTVAVPLPPERPRPPKPAPPPLTPAQELERIKKKLGIEGSISGLGAFLPGGWPAAVACIVAGLIDELTHPGEPLNPVFGGSYE